MAFIYKGLVEWRRVLQGIRGGGGKIERPMRSRVDVFLTTTARSEREAIFRAVSRERGLLSLGWMFRNAVS